MAALAALLLDGEQSRQLDSGLPEHVGFVQLAGGPFAAQLKQGFAGSSNLLFESAVVQLKKVGVCRGGHGFHGRSGLSPPQEA